MEKILQPGIISTKVYSPITRAKMTKDIPKARDSKVIIMARIVKKIDIGLFQNESEFWIYNKLAIFYQW